MNKQDKVPNSPSKKDKKVSFAEKLTQDDPVEMSQPKHRENGSQIKPNLEHHDHKHDDGDHAHHDHKHDDGEHAHHDHKHEDGVHHDHKNEGHSHDHHSHDVGGHEGPSETHSAAITIVKTECHEEHQD